MRVDARCSCEMFGGGGREGDYIDGFDETGEMALTDSGGSTTGSMSRDWRANDGLDGSRAMGQRRDR